MQGLLGTVPSSILDSRTVAGQFWLPVSAERRVGGLVRFQLGESITIDLLGGLQEKPSSLSGMPHPGTVWGTTVDGTPMTAFGVIESSSRMTSVAEVSELHANVMVFGAHLDSLEEARFTTGVSYLTNLARWCGEGMFSVEFGEEPYGPIAAHASRPREFDVEIPQLGARLSLHGAIGSVTTAEEARLTFHPYVSVRSTEPKTLEWFDRVLGDFRDLIAVCTFSPILLESLSMSEGPDARTAVSVHRAVWYREAIAPLSPHRMPIRLKDLLPDIERVLPRWYDLTSRARPAIDLFLSVVFRGIHLNSFAFLAMTQAAEAFHCLTEGGSYESKEDYRRHRKAIIASLPSDLPPELRARLESSLAHGNELSLKSRLESLFSRDGALPREITAHAYQDIAEIVWLRNALTHSTKGRVETVQWQRLNRCVRHLQVVLLAHFFGYIGLPDECIRGRLGTLSSSLRFLGQP